jgi:diguanylate cyclase (GGDEF)-like protein
MNSPAVRNRILIIDDETSTHLFLTDLLSPDYDIYAAKDGQSGVRKAKELLPCLILLDIIMPGMSGFEVMAALKGAAETRDIPIVFITGLSDTEDEIKGLASDAADYIFKPFSAGIVKLRVRNLIKIVNQIRTINLLSTTDQLTGIPNRRGFDTQMLREWGRTMREGLPLSILMIDVDNFKKYNDTYGHPQGDEVLRAVAKTLTGTLARSIDYAARYGGEEFAVILPNTGLQGAMKIAEQIRANVEGLIIPLVSGEPTGVTVSIGAHTMVPSQTTLPDELIAIADKALYTAKESGRNRVCAGDM